MNENIFEFLKEYGEALLQILGFSECCSAYGQPFVIWYNTKHKFGQTAEVN